LKDYHADELRNVALVGHGSDGKTTVAEAMLYLGKATDRLGKVTEGNTVSDYDPEEIKRKISLNTSVLPIEWRNCKLNIIDTPGYFDFVGEMLEGLRAVDSAMIVVSAVSGIEVGTEKAWDYADQYGLSKMVFVNQMDRENADFDKTVSQLKDKYGTHILPLQLAIMQNDRFAGFIDLIGLKAYAVDNNGQTKEIPIPPDMNDSVQEAREAVIESAAEGDEALMEKFFDGQQLTIDEIKRGIKAGVLDGSVVPVLCGAGFTAAGINQVMDAIIDYMPSPKDKGADENKPFSAIVFKTVADPFVGKLSLFRVESGHLTSDTAVYNSNQDKTEKVGQIYLMRGKKQVPVDAINAGDIGAIAKLQYTVTGDTLCDPAHPVKLKGIDFPAPVISKAVEPKSKGDEDKISMGLHRLAEEDPTFTVEKNVETGDMLISGIGELHLETITQKLHSKFGTDVILRDPKIPYRETIRKSAKAEGKHKKQTGGHGQYGHVWIEFQPLSDSSETFVFEDKIVGGVVPRQYIPAVEKGLRECMEHGVLAGYPLIGVKAILYDGSYHPVDSSEMAFKVAASLAYRKGIAEADPILLEPIMHVEVIVPEEYMGDIMGDINKRRGRILGMNQVEGGLQQIVAEVPMAEMFKYATELRSMTQARGTFTMRFERYEEVPSNIAAKIIEEAKRAQQEE
jgi:elongation factor G